MLNSALVAKAVQVGGSVKTGQAQEDCVKLLRKNHKHDGLSLSHKHMSILHNAVNWTL